MSAESTAKLILPVLVTSDLGVQCSCGEGIRWFSLDCGVSGCVCSLSKLLFWMVVEFIAAPELDEGDATGSRGFDSVGDSSP